MHRVSSTTPHGDRPLAVSWDGSAWRLEFVPTPAGADAYLYGVSCTSATACTAVGDFVGAGGLHALIERWDGWFWHVQPTTDPPGSIDAVLASVSCSTADTCAAVGTTSTDTGQQPLAERPVAGVWRVVSAPNPPGSSYAGLESVSCSGWSTCTAVGYDQDPARDVLSLAERWNGSSWAIEPTPRIAGTAETDLDGVSCTTEQLCVAVGYDGNGPIGSTLAEVRSPAGWTVLPTASPPGSSNATLAGVSCPRLRTCTAVGSFEVGANGQLTLAERYGRPR